MKTCPKCGQTKPLTEFHNDKNRRDGKYPRCKTCKVADASAHYHANLEAGRAQRREYRANHLEQVRAKDRDYATRRDGIRDPSKPWPEGWCSYDAAHQRTKRERGRASGHTCIDCGGQAADWSYSHAGEIEFSQERKSKGVLITVHYSPNPADYDPRCKACHTKFDRHDKLEVAA